MKRTISKHVLLLILALLPIACHSSSSLSQRTPSAIKALPVYEEARERDQLFWVPSGWMPDGAGISFQDNFKEGCHSGETCIKLAYNSEKNDWVGIYWLAGGKWEGPGVNVFEELGVDKSWSVVLTFWARGEKGGENVQFKVGGVSNGNDSIEFAVETDWIRLTQDWRKYSIDLSNKDLSNVVGGFCWVTKKSKNRGKKVVRIFVDDIKYEVR